jgi:hypothetical protein
MENEMRNSVIWRSVALMATFIGVGLTLFTENVRTVQILGLFACGAVFGASLAAIIAAVRGRQKQA